MAASWIISGEPSAPTPRTTLRPLIRPASLRPSEDLLIVALSGWGMTGVNRDFRFGPQGSPSDPGAFYRILTMFVELSNQ